MTTNRLLASLAAAMGFFALVPGASAPPPGGPAVTTALDVAKALRDAPEALRVVDIRSRTAYEDFHLPRAVNFPLELDATLTDAVAIEGWLNDLRDLDIQPRDPIVVGGSPEASTREAWLALRKAGYQASYMPDMLGDWVRTIVSPVRAPTEDPGELTRWAEIASLSRYFGGLPRVIDSPEVDSLDTTTLLQRARRRGCAF